MKVSIKQKNGERTYCKKLDEESNDGFGLSCKQAGAFKVRLLFSVLSTLTKRCPISKCDEIQIYFFPNYRVR